MEVVGSGSDDLNLGEVQQLLEKLLSRGAHDELVRMVLEILGKLGRRTAALEFELARLKRTYAGRTSEKVDPAQLALLLDLVAKADRADDDADLDDEAGDEDDDEDRDEDDDEDRDEASQGRRRGHGRQRLPEHLGREDRVIEAAPDQVEGMHKIGYADSETLEWRPGGFFVIRTRRTKYRAPDGEGSIVTAPPPPQIVMGGLAEPGLVAHVIVSKYDDGLPLTRQRKIYKRQGVELAVGTMVGWIKRVHELAQPLVERIGQLVLASHLVQTDDTGIQALDRKADGGSKRGHLWGYLGDHKWACFSYTPDWKSDDARAFLRGRDGLVQADAYKGYDRIFNRPGSKAVEVGCWAHARRYFFEAKEGGDARAAIALDLMGELYKVERKASREKMSHTRRQALREKRSRAILDRLLRWVAKMQPREPPSSPLGRAFTYLINQRIALHRFLGDGRIPLDNTGAERALRGIAVGRKNYLFVGSDDGGERAATMYTLIRTCELNRIEPWAYLRDVILKLASGWPADRIDELLPPNWADAQPAAA